MQAEQGHLFIEAARGGKRGTHVQLSISAIEVGTSGAHRLRNGANDREGLSTEGLRLFYGFPRGRILDVGLRFGGPRLPRAAPNPLLLLYYNYFHTSLQ